MSQLIIYPMLALNSGLSFLSLSNSGISIPSKLHNYILTVLEIKVGQHSGTELLSSRIESSFDVRDYLRTSTKIHPTRDGSATEENWHTDNSDSWSWQELVLKFLFRVTWHSSKSREDNTVGTFKIYTWSLYYTFSCKCHAVQWFMSWIPEAATVLSKWPFQNDTAAYVSGKLVKGHCQH